MINQVDFEGYLTRAWEYREQRYMRLANHRPGEDGQTSSDYITILIDSALDFDPRRVKVGRLVRVRGRIVGRDIVESLKMVVAKSHDGVVLPGELSTLVIRRPTVQILAIRIRSLSDAKNLKTKAGPKSKPVKKKTELPVVPLQVGVELAELTTTPTRFKLFIGNLFSWQLLILSHENSLRKSPFVVVSIQVISPAGCGNIYQPPWLRR
jgi:hypothetical protein